MKQPFATGKDAWKSTLTPSSQNKTTKITASNMPQRKTNKSMTGEELLTKALKGK